MQHPASALRGDPGRCWVFGNRRYRQCITCTSVSEAPRCADEASPLCLLDYFFCHVSVASLCARAPVEVRHVQILATVRAPVCVIVPHCSRSFRARAPAPPCGTSPSARWRRVDPWRRESRGFASLEKWTVQQLHSAARSSVCVCPATRMRWPLPWAQKHLARLFDKCGASAPPRRYG